MPENTLQALAPHARSSFEEPGDCRKAEHEAGECRDCKPLPFVLRSNYKKDLPNMATNVILGCRKASKLLLFDNRMYRSRPLEGAPPQRSSGSWFCLGGVPRPAAPGDSHVWAPPSSSTSQFGEGGGRQSPQLSPLAAPGLRQTGGGTPQNAAAPGKSNGESSVFLCFSCFFVVFC